MKRRKRKLWSVPRITHAKYPGVTVRITELAPGGNLYAVRMVGGKQKMASTHRTRATLGRTAKEQEQAARALAMDLIEALATGAPTKDDAGPQAELTLGQLADRYEARGFFGRTEGYRKQQCSSIRRLAAYLDATRPVTSLKASDFQAYYTHRTTEDGVRIAARGDIVALKIACNWATDEGLFSTNPLARIKLAKIFGKHTPRRPWATEERYKKLRAVADQLLPAFGVLLDLAWATGHRIGAILALRWEHVCFDTSDACPYGSVRWYAGRAENNKAVEHVAPMNALAQHALERWREHCPGIGSAFLFPPTRDKHAGTARSHHGVKGLLARAEKLAGLPHEAQGGWHMFRRGWATARKHLPLKDVAAAGGWRDTATVLKSYQHDDPTTTLAVVNNG